MSTVAVYLVVTFGLGLLAIVLRLPPLVGFLAAGFVLNAIHVEHLAILDTIASLGVTLLLFGIGLKLDVRSLLQKEVWLTASLHLGLSVAVGAAFVLGLGATGLALVAGLDASTAALIAFALAFSSTVFVVKVLEDRGQSHAFYGRVAIGILIIQDIAAVIFLTIADRELPNPWALALVGLWPLSRIIRAMWSRVGHGELQSLFGIVMAFVPGYLLFDLVGLKGDLGALIMGMLLASHPASSELSRALFHIKELLLVGFFVSIGLTGLPTLDTVVVAALLLLLLPLKAAGYVGLLWALRLRHRTSILTGFVLMNYSEFGLIVIAVGVQEGLVGEDWLLILSLTVAMSFVVSSLANGPGARLVERLASRLPTQDDDALHPEDQPADADGAHVVVLGMGRVGQAAYQRLEALYGLPVVGIDNDGTRVAKLADRGLNVVEGDANDLDFWRRLRHKEHLKIAILAMPRHGANLSAVRLLRDNGFTGTIAAVARYEDEVRHALDDGADAAFNVYAGAGLELGDQVARLERPELTARPDPVEQKRPLT